MTLNNVRVSHFEAVIFLLLSVENGPNGRAERGRKETADVYDKGF